MKKLINNIDCVRIELDGVNQTYYLPRATNFNGRFIDAIYFYKPTRFDQIDFLTGKPLARDLSAVSLNLRDNEQNDIVQNYPITYSSTGLFYNMAAVCDRIDWENSYIRVAGSENGVLLMYVFYATTADECAAVKQRRTVEVAAGADTALKPLINSAFFDEVKELTVAAPNRSDTYGFITLVTADGRVFDYMPLALFWQKKNGKFVSAKRGHAFNKLTIDWQKSHVYNSDIEPTKITFGI